jgi:hypothetical protein
VLQYSPFSLSDSGSSLLMLGRAECGHPDGPIQLMCIQDCAR